VVCQLRRVYDPDNYRTSWDEDRRGERGCVQNKRELADVLNAVLEPLRARRKELLTTRDQLDMYLREGADRARAVACDTMGLVRQAMRLA
jgi:tryptophanyl-tRNA synthetase